MEAGRPACSNLEQLRDVKSLWWLSADPAVIGSRCGTSYMLIEDRLTSLRCASSRRCACVWLCRSATATSKLLILTGCFARSCASSFRAAMNLLNGCPHFLVCLFVVSRLARLRCFPPFANDRTQTSTSWVEKAALSHRRCKEQCASKPCYRQLSVLLTCKHQPGCAALVVH